MSEEERNDYRNQELSIPLNQDAYDRNLIRDILDPSDIIELIEFNLKGYKINPNYPEEVNKWIKDEGRKAIRLEGVKLIVGLLNEQMPKNQTLASLTDIDIRRLARDIWFATIGLIYENWEIFTYEGEEAVDPPLALFDKIVYLVDHNVFTNLTRARNGTENKLLRTVYRTHDVVAERATDIQDRTKRGMFSNLFGRNRNNAYIPLEDRPLYSQKQ
jgi:hypothetical protein